MHKINDVIDADTAELIATEFGHTAEARLGSPTSKTASSASRTRPRP